MLVLFAAFLPCVAPQENSALRGHCKAMLGPVSCNSPDSLFNRRVQIRFMMSPSFDNQRVNSKKYVQATLRRPVIEFLFLYLLVVQFDDEAVLIFSLTMIQPQNSHWSFTQKSPAVFPVIYPVVFFSSFFVSTSIWRSGSIIGKPFSSISLSFRLIRMTYNAFSLEVV